MGVVHRDQLGYLGEDGVDVGVVVLGQQKTKVGTVGGEDDAVAIEDDAARRRGEQELELVVFREHLVAACLDQLELGEPSAERHKAHAGETAEEEGSAVEPRLTLVDVVEIDGGLDHRKRTSARS